MRFYFKLIFFILIITSLALSFGIFYDVKKYGIHDLKKFFPYKQIYIVKKSFRNLFSKKILIENSKKGTNFENEFFKTIKLPNKIKFEKSIDLNNFYLDWSEYEVTGIKKLAHFEIVGSFINYLNQDDTKWISKFGLSSENLDFNGGIKSVFKIKDRYFAYVAYVKKNCAFASIFEFPSGKKQLDFPCIKFEDSEIDLNGIGGAFLKLSDGKHILSTGTPTSTSQKVRELAQDDNSPYGKILELYFDNNNQLNYSIFSKGHRNPQGIYLSEKNVISVEHGPKGGDEVNLLFKGKNYGWPLTSLGSNYDLTEISKSTFFNEIETEVPLFSFTPAIGISTINSCPKMYLEYYSPLKCIAVGSLVGTSIFLILIDENYKRVLNYERLKFTNRIRKFYFINNTLIAGTDYDKLIIGKLNKNF